MSDNEQRILDTIVRIIAMSCADINVPPKPEYLPQILLKCNKLGEKGWGTIILALHTIASSGGDTNIVLLPPPLLGRIKRMCVIDWKTLELEGHSLTEYIGYRASYETSEVKLRGKEYYVYVPTAVAIGVEYSDVSGKTLVNGYILAKTNEAVETGISTMETKLFTLAYINPATPLMKAIMEKCGLSGTIVDAEEYLFKAIERGHTHLYGEKISIEEPEESREEETIVGEEPIDIPPEEEENNNEGEEP